MEQANYAEWRYQTYLQVKKEYPEYNTDEIKNAVDDIEKRVKSYFPEFFWNFVM